MSRIRPVVDWERMRTVFVDPYIADFPYPVLWEKFCSTVPGTYSEWTAMHFHQAKQLLTDPIVRKVCEVLNLEEEL